MATLSECKLPGCAGACVARGFCNRHYRQWKRGSLTEAGVSLRPVRQKGPPQEGPCCVPSCCREDLVAYFLCRKHYGQYRKGIINKDGSKARELQRKYAPPGEGERRLTVLSAHRRLDADGYVFV